MPEWEPSSLPPMPVKEISIPIAGPIISIVFTIFFMIIFAFAPQLMGAYYFSSTSRVIPIFDLQVLHDVLPLILICFGLGIIRNVWEIIERRITIRYAVFALIINVIKTALLVMIFTQFPIWNRNFIAESSALFHNNPISSVEMAWNQITANLVIFLVIIYVLDSAATIYKAFKYAKGMDEFR
jgi:hypothetical protein